MKGRIKKEKYMLEVFKKKLGGLENSINEFSYELWNSSLKSLSVNNFTSILKNEINSICDDSFEDEVGNQIGVMNGFRSEGDILIVSNHKFGKNVGLNEITGKDFRYGIVSGLYSLALLKRTLLPLTGNVIFCCINHEECSDKNIKFLFDNYLKNRKIKTVILSEPTGFNVFIGNKGRLEYEIVVKGLMDESFMAKNGINMLGVINPLLAELESVNKVLPRNYELGSSSLKIKDVKYGSYSPKEKIKEFHVLVDRFFVPEEDGEMILEKARIVAQKIFPKEKNMSINTMIVKDKTSGNSEILVEKEIKPWKMESHNPVVLKTLEALHEGNFDSNVGYWKSSITDGSFTYGIKNIPTIGFGAGNESASAKLDNNFNLSDILDNVFGLGLIIHRNIGLPTFGWCEDEI
jgi:hypothetical protein